MSNPSKIKSKPYRNWVRGALGLVYLQEGLYPFTDRVVKAEHARIVQNLKSCTGCAIENILPAHASGKDCIQKNKARCNCRKKTNLNCATCSNIYDEIVLQHRFREPHWMTDCSTWYNDHWQFAKCFMTTTIKGSANTAADTDASGLLSIIINGEFFQSKLQCNINPPNDILCQVRNIRHEILHNATQELTDKEVTYYLESMIAVLEDKKTLSLDQAAQAATKKLKEILKDELNITLSEEAKVFQLIQTELDAIKKSIRTLEQQKEDFTAEINDVKQKYEPKVQRIEEGHGDHEKRIESLEEGQQILEKRVLKLENEIAKLKDTEGNLQERCNYLKDKLDLQLHLVDEYQKENVKTWISPLMTQQNNVNISDVYASPRMVVEEKENDKEGSTTEAGKDRATNNKHIEIGDLFGTVKKRNRKIFIVGNVGTGKSSLCKMMMQHWCSSITKRRNSDNSGVKDEEGVTQEKDNDTYGINQFDFLFYVPLRAMSEGTDDIVDMIKGRLRKYKTLVDDIFTNDSERVLILADGLDELTLSKPRGPQWVPKSSLDGGSTILTTSRPSSRGILNMKSSDCDLKVTLLGLKDNKSVQNMIEKYMKLLNKTSDVVAFNKVLSHLPFKDIHNAPMLLQQIIWLHCNGHKIGQSRSSVYIHIVNAVLGWYYERKKASPELESASFEKFLLPKPFDKFRNCQENNKLLLLLGKIAHDAYITGNNSSLAFGRLKLKQLGISGTDIDTIVQTGILTEVNCADPTYEKSQLSFIHTSYVEFFAALYICSSYLSNSSDSPSSNPFTILARLIAVTSVTEILRLENVLIMICGLDPRLTEHVCECIYKLTPSDENTDKNSYRVKRQIYDLTYECLSEHNSFDQETGVKWKLRHFDQRYRYSFDRELFVCFTNLVPTSVETFRLVHCSLSHEQCLSLESWLSQAVSIQTLKVKDIRCPKDECEGHTIDLTDHKELRSIKLAGNTISVSGINHTCLQSFRISNCKLSHEQCSLLSSCLSQAVSLRTLEIIWIECTKDKCEGHTIDLTKHKELQSIMLSWSETSVSGIKSTVLESCRLIQCRLSHEQCTSLSSCLSQATLLKKLELYDVECIKPECERHCIDLSSQNQLLDIKISRCDIMTLSKGYRTLFITGINPTIIKRCDIRDCFLSHKHCTSLCTFLSQAESLDHISLHEIKCIKRYRISLCLSIEYYCEGHYIDLTNHKRLEDLNVSNCNMISITGINPTFYWRCLISNCDLSHEQCTSLCTFLSQAESLYNIELSNVKCIEDACEGHYIDLTNCKQLEDLYISFCNMISITGKPTGLKWCIIKDCNLSHEQCKSLCTLLSHSILLRHIGLITVKCTKEKCEGHIFRTLE